jgi:hypothetical protein
LDDAERCGRRRWLSGNEGKRKCAQNLNFSSLATRAEARYFTVLEAISKFKMGIFQF